MAWLKDRFCLRLWIALGTLLIGCNSHTIRVELPHGYTGDVRIDCGTRSDVQSIPVGATGHLTDAVCPVERTKLVIVLDGKIIQSIDAANWGTSGDKLPVSVEFSVR